MAYLGNTPASRFTSMDKQTITGDGGTDYTLDHAVGSEQEIEVFVNNVRQEPSVAYTVAGTALTMTGNVASTDDFYVVFQGKAQQSVTHPSNSALQATTGTFSGAVTATSFSGDGSSLTGISSNAGVEYFEVDLTTDQASLTDSSNVVVDFGGSGTVVYDTSSNFDSANDAYLLDSSNGVYIISYSCGVSSNSPPTEQIIYAHAGVEVATDGSTYSAYKSGSSQMRNSDGDSGGSLTLTGSFIYKATNATTKIRLKAFADNATTSTWRIGSTAANIVQVTGSSDLANAKVTWMSVMRIA